jgi:hypothetical protein
MEPMRIPAVSECGSDSESRKLDLQGDETLLPWLSFEGSREEPMAACGTMNGNRMNECGRFSTREFD